MEVDFLQWTDNKLDYENVSIRFPRLQRDIYTYTNLMCIHIISK